MLVLKKGGGVLKTIENEITLVRPVAVAVVTIVLQQGLDLFLELDFDLFFCFLVRKADSDRQ